MRSIQRLSGPLGVLFVLLLLVGCGPKLPPGATNLPTTTPTKLSSTSSSASASTPTARAGAVTLHTDKSLYQAGDTISVTVSNQSQQTIFFPDHLTNCTVILLQRQKAQPQTSSNGQATINPCLLMITTRMHTLLAGQRLTVPLAAPRSGWPAGLYFATLSYHPVSATGPSTPISSAAFAVGSQGTLP